MSTLHGGTALRMSPEARREQLLAVGASLFGDSSYDDVWIEEVARRAGVSRGLLYHYFPTKRDYFMAVLEYNGSRMRIAPDPEPGVPAEQQLRSGLRQFLTQISSDSRAFRAAHRMRHQDPAVGDIIGRSLAEQERRLLNRVMAAVGHPGDEAPEPLRLAVHGWLGYVNAIVLDWLESGVTALEDMVDLLAGTFEAAVHHALVAVGRAQRRAEELATQGISVTPMDGVPVLDVPARVPGDAGAAG